MPGPCRSVRRRGHPGSVRSQNSSFGCVLGVSGSGALPRWLCVTLSYPQLPILLSNNGLVPAAASRGPHRSPCCDDACKMLAIASGLLYGLQPSVQRRGSSPISTDRREAPSPRDKQRGEKASFMMPVYMPSHFPMCRMPPYTHADIPCKFPHHNSGGPANV